MLARMSGIVVAVLGLLPAAGTLACVEASGPQPQRPAATPQAAEGLPEAAKPHEVSLDLAEAPPELTLRIPVPPRGSRLVHVYLVNRVSRREYVAGGIPEATTPQFVARREFPSLNVPAIAIREGPSAPADGPPRCAAAADARRKLAAAPDERAVAARLKEFVAAAAELDSTSCPAATPSEVRAAQESVRSGPLVLNLDGQTAYKIHLVRMPPRGTPKIWPTPPGSKPEGAEWRIRVEPQAERWQWLARTETEWLVRETALDVAEMILHGAGPRAGVAAPRFEAAPTRTAASRVVVGELSAEVVPEPHVWSPEAYGRMATSLLQGLGLRAGESRGSGPLLAPLLEPTPVNLARVNLQVSRRLNQDMLDPLAHEQAALLLGSLALREAAGEFSDTRWALCRMAAHLALAGALRGSAAASAEGRIAAAALSALAGRQREALSLADSLAGESLAPWRRALRVRITADYRELGAGRARTLLERRERYRALRRHAAVSQALAALSDPSREAIPDWGHLALDPGVDLAQLGDWSQALEAQDLAELEQVWTLEEHGSWPSRDRLPAAMNEAAGRCIGGSPALARVVPRGAWAAFVRRRVLHAALSQVEAYASLGRPKEVLAEIERNRREWGGLEAYPALAVSYEVRRRSAGESQGGAGVCEPFLGLIRRSPEALPASLWGLGLHRCPSREAPQAADFFAPPSPTGSAYDVYWRSRLRGLGGRSLVDAETWSRWFELAPFNALIARQAALGPAASEPPPAAPEARGEPKVPLARVQQFLGPSLEYSIQSLAVAIDIVAEPEAQLDLKERRCRLEPESCFDLGEQFALMGREARAAAAYERGLRESADRIFASHHADWLIDYYLDHGRARDAQGVASDAAQVYSGSGLASLARLLERLERFDEAREVYQRIQERYDDGESLEMFYMRHQTRVGDGRYQREADAAMTKHFPGGLSRVVAGELPPAPPERPEQDQAAMARFLIDVFPGLGLQEGDWIVAFDGYRTRSLSQLRLVATLSDEPTATATVWRDGRYQEVRGKLLRRKHGPPARQPRVGQARRSSDDTASSGRKAQASIGGEAS
jgi:tetratricopeptide (TPR) repeat protein